MYLASRQAEVASFEDTQRRSIYNVQAIETASSIAVRGNSRIEARKNHKEASFPFISFPFISRLI